MQSEQLNGQIRTPDDLQVYLVQHEIPAEMIHLTAETPTVPAAAEALGVPVDQIVKTVIFLVAGQPYAVFANGLRRIDPRKLAARFGVSRKKVRLADGQVVVDLTGYAPGTVPPFGHRQALPALMDPAVCNHEIVYAGGGGIAAMLRVRSADLLRLTGAELLNVLQEGSSEGASSHVK
jgi:prolyl-tRNA editing enzyme YbaK/EbsC (Cys-tRNA(Pro) deacylase)